MIEELFGRLYCSLSLSLSLSLPFMIYILKYQKILWEKTFKSFLKVNYFEAIRTNRNSFDVQHKLC